MNRNADGNAQVLVRERCDCGSFKAGTLKVRKESSTQDVCIPDSSVNSLSSKRPLSADKMTDMINMYSRFVDPEKWPSYIVENQRGGCTSNAPPKQQEKALLHSWL